jgi:transcriptional regulator with XRE-family HTH domain
LYAIYRQRNIRSVINLAELRRTAGMTQVQLADALATSQGQISRIERQSDMLLSTLSAYLTALGVEASLVVLVDGKTIAQELTEGRR